MKRSDPEEEELSSPDPHFASEASIKRKRNRVCLSCSVCRRRKVKCDRGKPCKRCASLGLSDQCTYQSPNWINAKSLELPSDMRSTPAGAGGAATITSSSNSVDEKLDTARKVGSNHKSKTPPDVELHNELHLLREKLSMIENTLKSGKGSNTPQPRNGELYSDSRSTPILDSSGTAIGGYGSLSPPKNFRLPRTSISSLMNPLPVSGTRYSYAPITSNEYSSESYLFHLGIDERERLEFSTVNKCTLLMDEASSSYTSFGPLSNFAILLQDNHLSSIRKEVMELSRKINKKSSDLPDNSGARLYDDDSPALNYNKEDTTTAIIINNFELNEAILSVLPKISVLKLLVDRYFSFVYPFLPILTKANFEYDIKRILGIENFDDDGCVRELNIKSNLDYAVLGSLLIVLKFGHGTLISNKLSNRVAATIELKSNVINVSHLCLRKFALFTQPSLKILQHGLLYRTYHAIQGFEGLSDNVPFIFNNLLIQMALGIGLNRDPKKFKQEKLVCPQLENRWRFLWQVVTHLDLTAFLTSGSHRVIRKEYCDTLTPYMVDQSLGLPREQLELENVIVKLMKIRAEFDELLFKVTDCICRLSPTPTAGELFGAIDNLETVISLRFGPLQILLTPKKKEEIEQDVAEEDTHIKNVEKVFQIAMYINSLSAIIPVMCHLIIFGEKKQNFTACRYFIARLIAIIMRIIAGYKQITTDSTNLFGEGFDWFISSNYSSLMHKALVGISVCFFRVTISRNNFRDNDPVKFGLLNTLLYNLFGFKVWNEYLPHAKKISSTRFYAWGLLKFHAFIQTLTEGAKNSDDVKSENYNVFDQMSISDIQAFIELSNIETYSSESEESALRIKTILENLKNGVSFKDSYTNKNWISLNEDNSTGIIEINKEYLPNEYEDKYWSELMLRDAYALDDKNIESLFDTTQINSIDSIYNNYYGLRN